MSFPVNRAGPSAVVPVPIQRAATKSRSTMGSIDHKHQVGHHRLRLVDHRLQLAGPTHVTIRPVPNEIVGDEFGRDALAPPQFVDPSPVERCCGSHIRGLPLGDANDSIAP